MSKFMKGPLILIIVIALIVVAAQFLSTPIASKGPEEYEYQELLEHIEAGDVQDISIQDYTVFGRNKDSKITDEMYPEQYDFKARIPSVNQFNLDVAEIAGSANPLDYGFNLNYIKPEETNIFLAFVPYLVPVLLLIIMFVFISRQTKGGGAGGAMNFGKSKARMTDGAQTKKTFADVAGADEEKEELQEIVQFLKSPQKFKKLGARIPKGVLLVGPPGGGKTLLAKAVAGEAGVKFFSISGSDFVEMFVGVGASRVRDLFAEAKKNAPCIIFIDEIDAVGRQRGAGLGGGHDEREQTLNQLLVEMDGFEVNEGIVVMAATNRKDILDPAILRPGRFDRQVYVSYPDVKGREEILKVHAKGKPFAGDVDLKVVAKRTPGFIGADLENVLNEAAILAARRNESQIHMEDVEDAITKVIAGPEKKSRIVSEEDKKCTAYHEVGHALLAHYLPHCDPVHEISIIQRGQAAGYTMTLPEHDNQHMFKSKLLDEIVMMLGGRVAESLVLKDVSTGAVNDLQRATAIAKEMVTKYGMSKLGPIFLSENHEVFLGREFGQQSAYSEQTAAWIDEEISKIMHDAYARAESILSEHMDMLHTVSQILMKKEKLTGEEFEEILRTGTLAEKPKEQPQQTKEKEEAESTENAENVSEAQEAEHTEEQSDTSKYDPEYMSHGSEDEPKE